MESETSMNRKRILAGALLVVLFVCLCCTACGKNSRSEENRNQNGTPETSETTGIVYDPFVGNASLTEKYALYHCNNGQLIHLLVQVLAQRFTGKIMTICLWARFMKPVGIMVLRV